jgi:hypothetical protein
METIRNNSGIDVERHEWIAIAAYYKSEKRGFAPVQELEDWLSAERDYADMLIASYLIVAEEDGMITLTSLMKLADAVGVPNTASFNLKSELIRAIQKYSNSRPCFQNEPYEYCREQAECQWRTECQKLIAVWRR